MSERLDQFSVVFLNFPSCELPELVFECRAQAAYQPFLTFSVIYFALPPPLMPAHAHQYQSMTSQRKSQDTEQAAGSQNNANQQLFQTNGDDPGRQLGSNLLP